MVAMTAKDYTVFYAAVALANGQTITFIEADTSMYEALVSIKNELYKEQWSCILVCDANSESMFDGDSRQEAACRKALADEYPAVFAKDKSPAAPPWKETPLIPFAKTWYPTPVVKFSKSSLTK